MKVTDQVEQLIKLADLIYENPSSFSKKSLEKKINDLNGDLKEGLKYQLRELYKMRGKFNFPVTAWCFKNAIVKPTIRRRSKNLRTKLRGYIEGIPLFFAYLPVHASLRWFCAKPFWSEDESTIAILRRCILSKRLFYNLFRVFPNPLFHLLISHLSTGLNIFGISLLLLMFLMKFILSDEGLLWTNE